MNAYLRGPFSVFGLGVAAVTGVLDQASKLYLLFVHDLPAHSVTVLRLKTR